MRHQAVLCCFSNLDLYSTDIVVSVKNMVLVITSCSSALYQTT